MNECGGMQRERERRIEIGESNERRKRGIEREKAHSPKRKRRLE